MDKLKTNSFLTKIIWKISMGTARPRISNKSLKILKMQIYNRESTKIKLKKLEQQKYYLQMKM